jgi:hypothetical protein
LVDAFAAGEMRKRLPLRLREPDMAGTTLKIAPHQARDVLQQKTETLVAADRLGSRALWHASLRRTKATLYKRTGNLRAVQLLLGYAKIESTVRYLGVEVNDALEISEQTDV